MQPNDHEPSDPLVAKLVSELDEDPRQYYEERAGIRQFDGQLTRSTAEALALVDLVHRYPAAFLGIITLQIIIDGETHWILTSDLDYTRKHLADIGASEVGIVDLREVIVEQYGGTACLTFLC